MNIICKYFRHDFYVKPTIKGIWSCSRCDYDILREPGKKDIVVENSYMPWPERRSLMLKKANEENRKFLLSIGVK